MNLHLFAPSIETMSLIVTSLTTAKEFLDFGSASIRIVERTFAVEDSKGFCYFCRFIESVIASVIEIMRSIYRPIIRSKLVTALYPLESSEWDVWEFKVSKLCSITQDLTQYHSRSTFLIKLSNHISSIHSL